MFRSLAQRGWFRFSMANFLVLILGIAIGFAPLKLWELYEASNSQVLVRIEVIEASPAALAALRLESANGNLRCCPKNTFSNIADP